MPAYVNGYVEGSEIVLLSRDEGGRLRETRAPAQHVAYFREGELPQDLRRKLQAVARSITPEPGGWLRVVFPSADVRKAVCFERETRNRETREVTLNPLLARGIAHYDADVDPITRHFTDTGDTIQRPRRAYVDLETDSRLPFSRKQDMRVLCWTVCDDQEHCVSGMLREWSDRAEKELLQALWEALEPYDQVCAWNGGEPVAAPRGDGFDFPVMFARSELLDVHVDARRLLYLDHLAAFRRMNMHAAESGEEKRSMRLEDVAQAVLGEGKDAFDARHTYEAWAAGGEARRNLLKYNVKDTVLMPRIEKRKGFLDLFAAICEVCRLFPETRSLFPTRQMDGYMLRLARERDHHFPSRVFHDKDEEDEEQFKGAFVVAPKSLDPAWRAKQGMQNGILRNVHVGDFSSMYPSIIIGWNMSTETKADIPVNGPIPPGHCRCPSTGTGFRTDVKGFLPMAVQGMLDKRKQYSELEATLPPGTPEWHDAHGRSNAYKVTANAFFGASGNKYSRFRDRAVAEGITQNGVWLARETIAAAEQRGWIVVYGDTDSIYVIGPTEEEFKAFCAWCNAELYPRIMAKQGCVEAKIKLAYEKEFSLLVFTAKKRYIGKFVHFKGRRATAASKPEIKGLEYKRGDSSRLASALIERVIGAICGGSEDLTEYHAMLSLARTHALEAALPLSEIVIGKGLNKSLGKWDDKRKAWVVPAGGYVTKKKADGEDAAMSPHVVVARMLAARGRDVSEGTKVEYVVVDAVAEDSTKRVIPAEDYAGECDRHYVWESLVYPPTWRLLEAAFPQAESHWKAWARSRPPKVRKARGSAGEGQELLFVEAPEKRFSGRPAALPSPPLPRH